MFITSLMILLDLLLMLSFAFVPYVTRKTELFGVSIPSAHSRDPELNTLRGRYRNIMLGLGVVLLVGTGLIAGLAGWETTAAFVIWLVIIGVYLIASFIAYLPFHFQMRRLKQAADWDNTPAPAVITTTTQPATTNLISPAWLLTFPLIIALGVGVLALVWPLVPDPVPTHSGLDGTPDAYSPKSWALLWPLLLTEVFLAIVLGGCFFLIRHARRQIDAARPQESLDQDNRFRRLGTILMIAIGDFLLVFIIALQLVTFLGSANPAWSFAPVIILVIGVFILMAWLMFGVGQGGSRLRARPDSVPVANYDDDHYWKLGQFYFNPADPALFVEARFGVGWTCNFARPATWAIIVGLFALVAGLLVAVFALTP